MDKKDAQYPWQQIDIPDATDRVNQKFSNIELLQNSLEAVYGNEQLNTFLKQQHPNLDINRELQIPKKYVVPNLHGAKAIDGIGGENSTKRLIWTQKPLNYRGRFVEIQPEQSIEFQGKESNSNFEFIRCMVYVLLLFVIVKKMILCI